MRVQFDFKGPRRFFGSDDRVHCLGSGRANTATSLCKDNQSEYIKNGTQNVSRNDTLKVSEMTPKMCPKFVSKRAPQNEAQNARVKT